MKLRQRLRIAAVGASIVLFAGAVKADDFENVPSIASTAALDVGGYDAFRTATDEARNRLTDAQGRIAYMVDLMGGAAKSYSKSFIRSDRYDEFQKGEVVNLIQALESQYGFTISSMTSWSSTSFTAFLTEQQVDALRGDSRIASIVKDFVVLPSADTTAVWSDSVTTLAAPPNSIWMARVNQSTEMVPWGKKAVSPSVTSNSAGNVIVYVIDQGVGQHTDLNVVEYVNAVAAPQIACGTRSVPGLSTCTTTQMPKVVGCYTHATAVAGVIGAKVNATGIRGIDPGAAIVSVSALPPSTGNCVPSAAYTASGIRSAINWIVADITANNQTGKPSVVNFSANWQAFDSSIKTDMRTLATPAAGYVGAFVVQSAGNFFADACSYGYTNTAGGASTNDGIMVVSAINNHGQPVVPLNGSPGFWKEVADNPGVMGHMPGSDFGNCVEAWAPGDEIFTTMGAVTSQQGNTTYQTYAYGSGTSFAAPHVAGLAAYLIETSSLATPAAVEQAVRSKFSNLGSKAPSTNANPTPGNPSAPSFHDANGNTINMPTLSPLAAGVPRNTPYAEFVIAKACMWPSFAAQPPSCTTHLDYANASPDLAIRPFYYYGTSSGCPTGGDNLCEGVSNSMAPNRYTLSRGSLPVWIAFDSYGVPGYTCDVKYVFGSSTATLYSGTLPYYYGQSVALPANSALKSSCTSASVNAY